MNNDKELFWWTCGSGRIEFQLAREVVLDCSHPGPCDADVEHWQPILGLNLDRKTMIRELLEYGAWEVRELCALSNEELEQKIIWIASNDISETPEFNEEYNYEE